MTSSTRRRSRSSPWRLAGGGGPAGGRAFTLVEMMLAMALLLALAGVAVLGLTGWLDSSRLPEGASQFAAAIRMARAEASNLGKRIQLDFSDPEGGTRILWEPLPLEEPGHFVEWTACSWKGDLPAALVRVRSSRLTGDSAVAFVPSGPAGAKEEEPSADRQAITFQPDRTSDSAVIELESTRESDARRAIVELDGLTGKTTVRLVMADELE